MNKVSIVITAYKRPKLLIEAVESCLKQTLLPYEIIIGDDSPDNSTESVIDKLLNDTKVNIKYIHNFPSLGQAKNVNMLFDQVSGDNVLLLHDDDLLAPESLETLINIFEKNSDISVAYGKQHIISEVGEIDPISSISFNKDFYRTEEFEGSILTPIEAGLGQQIPNNGYMLKSHIVKEQKWRTDIGVGCEYEFGFRLGSLGYKTYFINKYLGMYRLSAQSMSSSKNCDMAYQAFRIIEKFNANSEREKSIRLKRLYERAPIAITECINMGRIKEASDIYFSKWYRSRIVSLGGIKRLLYLLAKL